MLIRVYRNIVFIHDTYIFVSDLFGKAYRELPLLLMPRMSSGKRSEFPAIRLLGALSGLNPITSKTGFYKKIDTIEAAEKEINELIEKLKPKNVLEYIIRGLPRNMLQMLAKMGYIWLIPFKNITTITTEKYRDTLIIRINYKCPLLNTLRVFKMIYDPEVFDLIQKLYLLNR